MCFSLAALLKRESHEHLGWITSSMLPSIQCFLLDPYLSLSSWAHSFLQPTSDGLPPVFFILPLACLCFGIVWLGFQFGVQGPRTGLDPAGDFFQWGWLQALESETPELIHRHGRRSVEPFVLRREIWHPSFSEKRRLQLRAKWGLEHLRTMELDSQILSGSWSISRGRRVARSVIYVDERRHVPRWRELFTSTFRDVCAQKKREKPGRKDKRKRRGHLILMKFVTCYY